MRYKYIIDGVTGTIEAENEAEADIMIREEIEIRIESDENDREDFRKDR
uniref:Uncharacterized protein n=1 Tax=viral metagenome TaxID=1070528 RepID=A0A6H2A6T1_9ZZZZ